MRSRTRKRAAAVTRSIAWGIVAAGVAIASGSGRLTETLIFLPGTQPGTADSVAVPASACAACHSPADGRDVRISSEWSGSMMAHSARDPLFRAALAVTNKYGSVAGQNLGEYCIRCHSPSGWLAGRSEDGTGGSLRGTDLDGVQCDYCHRLVDPVHPDSTVPATLHPVPGYGNGMHAVQAAGAIRRGPRDGAAAAHPAMADTFQRSGSFCGVCHDVSNPFRTGGLDRIFLPPHSYAPLERTYSEWLMSAFPSEGPGATCQGCHMAAYPGYASSFGAAPARDDVSAHDLTGGNAFIPSILAGFWDGLDAAALEDAALRARATLGRAAALSGSSSREGGLLTATVRVTNLTGHKLPTGYPEGRRMWLTVVATDSAGDTVFASATYDTATATLLRDPHARIYEAVHGLTDSAASALGLPAGPSFHFGLNDTVLSDNRIPPRGFTNAGFASRLASPVGAAYADGVSWDDAAYPLPSTAASVHASLWYQTASREYIEFLRDENEGNVFDTEGWGANLHDAWERNGRSAPVLMDSLTMAVADTVTGARPSLTLPSGYRLDPPWPNPFNGGVTVRYALPRGEDLRIDVLDITGRVVARIAGGRRPAGEGTVRFSPSALAGGVYVVRMSAGGFSSSRKILFIR